jgi:adenosine deaminase
MTDLTRFISEIPKAELHLHIEGTLEPELMMELAARNNVPLPYATVEEVRAAYQFSCLQDFLDVYYLGMSVLVTEKDFFDLTWAYLEKVHSQRVTHVEIFFDPQGHTERGVSFDTALGGITSALERGEKDMGITSKLIMCFLRHLPEDSAFETLAAACRCKEQIFGVGLDSSEKGHPPAKFARVYGEARQAGFTPVAHAGEEGPADYVIEALDVLKIERIDHGNRALEDPALVARIADSGMAMTVCPLSNLRLGVIDDMKQHPLKQMLDAGICATVNSDDPSYFGGYVNENYLAVQAALGLDAGDITLLAKNSFTGSFMGDAEKAAALEQLDTHVQAFRYPHN